MKKWCYDTLRLVTYFPGQNSVLYAMTRYASLLTSLDRIPFCMLWHVTPRYLLPWTEFRSVCYGTLRLVTYFPGQNSVLYAMTRYASLLTSLDRIPFCMLWHVTPRYLLPWTEFRSVCYGTLRLVTYFPGQNSVLYAMTRYASLLTSLDRIPFCMLWLVTPVLYAMTCYASLLTSLDRIPFCMLWHVTPCYLLPWTEFRSVCYDTLRLVTYFPGQNSVLYAMTCYASLLTSLARIPFCMLWHVTPCYLLPWTEFRSVCYDTLRLVTYFPGQNSVLYAMTRYASLLTSLDRIPFCMLWHVTPCYLLPWTEFRSVCYDTLRLVTYFPGQNSVLYAMTRYASLLTSLDRIPFCMLWHVTYFPGQNSVLYYDLHLVTYFPGQNSVLYAMTRYASLLTSLDRIPFCMLWHVTPRYLLPWTEFRSVHKSRVWREDCGGVFVHPDVSHHHLAQLTAHCSHVLAAWLPGHAGRGALELGDIWKPNTSTSKYNNEDWQTLKGQPHRSCFI